MWLRAHLELKAGVWGAMKLSPEELVLISENAMGSHQPVRLLEGVPLHKRFVCEKYGLATGQPQRAPLITSTGAKWRVLGLPIIFHLPF